MITQACILILLVGTSFAAPQFGIVFPAEPAEPSGLYETPHNTVQEQPGQLDQTPEQNVQVLVQLIDTPNPNTQLGDLLPVQESFQFNEIYEESAQTPVQLLEVPIEVETADVPVYVPVQLYETPSESVQEPIQLYETPADETVFVPIQELLEVYDTPLVETIEESVQEPVLLYETPADEIVVVLDQDLYETPVEETILVPVQEPQQLYEAPAESVQEPVQLYLTPLEDSFVELNEIQDSQTLYDAIAKGTINVPVQQEPVQLYETPYEVAEETIPIVAIQDPTQLYETPYELAEETIPVVAIQDPRQRYDIPSEIREEQIPSQSALEPVQIVSDVIAAPSDDNTSKAGMMLMPYDFDFGVRDDESGNSFSHVESSDGAVTRGEYRVLLPDGRTQVVKFLADSNGYNAEVTYV